MGSAGRSRVGMAIAATATAAGLYTIMGRPWLRRWGATAQDAARPLPGDRLLPHAVYQSTRAITIDALPDAIWPWLAQMGQGRGGFYSFDWVENLRGLEIRSAKRVIPEYQDLNEGDIVRLAPHTALVAAVVESERALVLRATVDADSKRPPAPTDPNYFNWTWAFVLEPAGLGKTRLLIRLRADTAQTFPLNVLGPLVWEPLHFLMERQMLRGIRRRAEGD